MTQLTQSTLACWSIEQIRWLGSSSEREGSQGMATEDIPADLRDFLLRYIDSVAQLEALILLNDAPEGWTPNRLAARLYIPDDQALPLLHSLRETGFVEIANDQFRYTGGNAEQQQTIRRLTEYYASHIVSVSHLIHSKPRRIREFAKAFRLKRDR
jgi:hypothetical protein